MTLLKSADPNKGRVVYEDDTYRQYDSGEEEVGFTEEEWAHMLSDPAYGYICQARKHRIDGGTRNWSPAEGCMLCFAEMEAWEPEEDDRPDTIDLLFEEYGAGLDTI